MIYGHRTTISTNGQRKKVIHANKIKQHIFVYGVAVERTNLNISKITEIYYHVKTRNIQKIKSLIDEC